MSTLAGKESVEIAAPPEVVWRYRLDFTNLPAYNPAVSDLERVADGIGPYGELGPGAEYHFTLSSPYGAHPVSLTITSAGDGREVRAMMTGAMGANETFTVTPTDGGTLAELTLWVELPAELDEDRARVLLDNGRKEIRAELDAMKANLEGAD